MRTSQALAVHQVHTVKLAADLGGAALAAALVWRGHHRSGLAVRYLAPLVGSAAVLTRADMDRLAGTGRGRYAEAYLSPTAQATRVAGDTVLMWGAARRSWPVVSAGIGLVALGWSQGLVRPRRVRTTVVDGTAYRPVPRRGGW